jgi:DNA-binding NarL/FixJ family response regulator
MDLNMPVLNGLEATRQITKLGIQSPILVFTMHEAGNLGDSVKQVGARGYVFKSRAASDLIGALESLLAGGDYFPAIGKVHVGEKKGPDISFLQ